MKNKSNEATAIQLEGKRILNAALVQTDLYKIAAQLKMKPTAFYSGGSYFKTKSDYSGIAMAGAGNDR